MGETMGDATMAYMEKRLKEAHAEGFAAGLAAQEARAQRVEAALDEARTHWRDTVGRLNKERAILIGERDASQAEAADWRSSAIAQAELSVERLNWACVLEVALREWLAAYDVGAKTSYETTEREIAAMAAARAALSQPAATGEGDK
jgi:hypothetical protein